VAPESRIFTARRRRSFSTAIGNLGPSVFPMPVRRVRRKNSLTYEGLISNKWWIYNVAGNARLRCYGQVEERAAMHSIELHKYNTLCS
jgi:hypothetical protein